MPGERQPAGSGAPGRALEHVHAGPVVLDLVEVRGGETAEIVASPHDLKPIVRPGGTVATYMWDQVGDGSPIEPIFAELRSMGIETTLPPSVQASTAGQGSATAGKKGGRKS